MECLRYSAKWEGAGEFEGGDESGREPAPVSFVDLVFIMMRKEEGERVVDFLDKGRSIREQRCY
jgi:hypothetical protein